MFVMTAGLNRYANRLPRQVICGPFVDTTGYIRIPTPAIMNEVFFVPIWEIRILNVRREAKRMAEETVLF
jgi:hypothetical protein